MAVLREHISQNDVIENSKSKVSLRPDGILQVEVNPRAEFGIEDALEQVRAQSVLAQGRRRPLLVIPGNIKFLTREARMYLGGKEAAKNVSAAGVLVTSPLVRVIANFFAGFNKSTYPMRLFESEAAAIEWLKGYLERGPEDA